MKRVITDEKINDYESYLFCEEKSKATIEKYKRDLKKLKEYAKGQEITKELLIKYKEYLQKGNYKVSSINSYIVAVNRFVEYMGWYGLNIKTLRIQNEVFYPEEKELSREEYKRLVGTANREKKYRLAMILQTICATGIRVSELSALTVMSVKKGFMEVNNKGKIRKVLIQDKLQKQLLMYIAKNKINKGVIFRNKSGKPVNRCGVWREMKSICKKARVKETKVFPHNLRHLFAKTFYSVKKDISKLADILGHSNIETTRIYLKTSSKEYRKQLNKMDLVLEI